MDDKLPITAQTPREDSFDITVRGFNRQQVLEYMSRSSQLLASLEQNLAVARADLQQARSEAERARTEADRLREVQQVEAKPAHQEVSARLSQILALAAEEADQERATAEEEIAKLRSESQAEAERLVSEARAEADRVLAEARETAEREIAETRANVEEDLRSARDEAERIRLLSEEQAREVFEDAARRAGAVNEVSDQRLDTLTATHGEAVLRLGQIRDVLADLLDRDAAAGSLAQAVEAVVGPVPDPELGADLELEPDLEPAPEAEVAAAKAEAESEAAESEEAESEEAESEEAEPEAESKEADLDETRIVPAVGQTAVHEPIQAAIVEPDRKIDLRDGAETGAAERLRN